ncbi:MAG: hypothetical protein PVI80_20155 [Anaerolineae bacterium]
MAQQVYEIRIEGHLGDSWSPWFEGMTIRHTERGETVLTGSLVDQTALHGVLMKVRDLGLPLVTVTRVEQTGAGAIPLPPSEPRDSRESSQKE